MELEIDRPELLGSLVAALRHGGCVCAELSRGRCVVWHVEAADARQADLELEFFLRAWRLQHAPVDVRPVA
jgi:hypothetical protein